MITQRVIKGMICLEHGTFTIGESNHLKGEKCPLHAGFFVGAVFTLAAAIHNIIPLCLVQCILRKITGGSMGDLEAEFAAINIPINLREVVRAPKNAVFYLPTAQLTKLQTRLHSMAKVNNCRLTCRNYYAFSPKTAETVTKLLRVEILEASNMTAPPVKRRKQPRRWSPEELR